MATSSPFDSMFDSITGVVLAGGKSARMGKSKAMLPISDEPDAPTFLEATTAILKKIFQRVVWSVNSPEVFADDGPIKIVDQYPEKGPLGGIASVLASGERRIFCVACDMPFLNERLIRQLCSFSEPAVIPVWSGKAQTMHALYSSDLLPGFHTALQKGDLKITNAIVPGNIRYISEEEMRPLDPKGLSFRNINTPEEYELLCRSDPYLL